MRPSVYLINIGKLCCWAIGLWFFFAIFSPFIQDKIPAWKRYNQIQEEQDLDSGALYYSNVPQTYDSEEHTRAAIKAAMEERRQKKLEARAHAETK